MMEFLHKVSDFGLFILGLCVIIEVIVLIGGFLLSLLDRD